VFRVFPEALDPCFAFCTLSRSSPCNAYHQLFQSDHRFPLKVIKHIVKQILLARLHASRVRYSPHNSHLVTPSLRAKLWQNRCQTRQHLGPHWEHRQCHRGRTRATPFYSCGQTKPSNLLTDFLGLRKASELVYNGINGFLLISFINSNQQNFQK